MRADYKNGCIFNCYSFFIMKYNRIKRIYSQLMTSGRIVIATMTVCCLLYGSAIMMFGQLVMPQKANGSLIRDENGDVLGSELIAQGFSKKEYLWPRPSAVDYKASAAGGSNLSPTNPELRSRAQAIMAMMDLTGKGLVPADLLTESGSGLDPHITLNGALFQSERIANARGLSIATVTGILKESSRQIGGFLSSEPIVNVLLVNLELDKVEKSYGQ
jgi:K+-transporting ATPase ATPase C chain